MTDSDFLGQCTEEEEKKKNIFSQRRSLTILERFSQSRQRDTRIDDQPAMPDDPKDHAATRGRDESLRQDGGHRPEYRTGGVGNRRYSGRQSTILTDSRTHCCKLRNREASASTAKQQSRSGLTLSSDVEGARSTESQTTTKCL